MTTPSVTTGAPGATGTYSRRRALLVGINYVATPQYGLRGCIYDVENMRDFLVSKTGLVAHRVRTLTDANGPGPVTRASIMGAMHLLCQQAWIERLESVFIHFSGHGTRIRDRSGDEDDGADECVVTSDLSVIDDDWIASMIRRFPVGCKVMCVFDCCHSGTVADMPYTYIPVSVGGVTSNTMKFAPRYINKSRPLPPVVVISGCLDEGYAAETFDHRRKVAGALTTALIAAWTADPSLRSDFARLLKHTHATLMRAGLSQVPVISASTELLSTSGTTFL